MELLRKVGPMGRAKRVTLCVAIILSLCSGLRAQGRIAWVESWAEAQMLAQRHRRLILVHFWSQNCPPCLKLERSVFNQPELIRALATNYVPLKINVDRDRARAKVRRPTVADRRDSLGQR